MTSLAVLSTACGAFPGSSWSQKVSHVAQRREVCHYCHSASCTFVLAIIKPAHIAHTSYEPVYVRSVLIWPWKFNACMDVMNISSEAELGGGGVGECITDSLDSDSRLRPMRTTVIMSGQTWARLSMATASLVLRTKRLLVLVLHKLKAPRNTKRILKEFCMLLPKIPKIRAISLRHADGHRAHCGIATGCTKCAPALMSRHLWPSAMLSSLCIKP